MKLPRIRENMVERKVMSYLKPKFSKGFHSAYKYITILLKTLIKSFVN